MPFQVIELGVAHVPEGRGAFPEMTVEENLVMGSLSPQAKASASRPWSGCTSFSPGCRSGASRPRAPLRRRTADVAIGRGLMALPKLLMFDEPSLGSLPCWSSTFSSVKKVNEEGLTVLLVEQNVHHTLAMCDRAYVLENGRIVLEGTGELMDNPHVKEAYLGI